jgi:hypothetical protein
VAKEKRRLAVQLTLPRRPSAKGATVSPLFLDGQHECYICEDVVRPASQKIFGKTAIPAGTYQVIINRSERFSKQARHDVFLPLLLHVPGYEGVRIHPGNGPADTEGCLLPGTAIGPDGASVAYSQAAFRALFGKMQAALERGETIKITIS